MCVIATTSIGKLGFYDEEFAKKFPRWNLDYGMHTNTRGWQMQ
jgi:hypothetical protein